MSELIPTGEPGPDPRLGEVIGGRYRLLDRIGRGGMGAIYEAEQLSTGRRVAVKTLLPGLGGVAEIARRFEREAQAASLLSHPNIVSVTDFGEFEDGSLYLVMELVRGLALGDVLEQERVPTMRALSITRQVLEALAHAHAAGIIHRDLKPDNIMLVDAGLSEEERDIVKLLDFGIAKIIDEAGAAGGDKLTQAGVAFGTPDYMAPEQALGEAVDPRADLYAAGAILFELLTGRRLYENADKMAVLRMQVSLAPPRLAAAAPDRVFAPEVQALLDRALAKRRDDRHATAEELFILELDAAAQAQTALDLDAAAEIAQETAATVGMMASAAPLAPLELDEPPPRLRPAAAGATSLLQAPGGRAVALVVTVAVAMGILTFATRGRGPDGKEGEKRAASTPVRVAAAGARPEQLARATRLLAKGEATTAMAILDEEVARPDGGADAGAHLLLGHARAAAGKDLEALAAYERAIELAPEMALDGHMRTVATAMMDRKDKRIVYAAIDFLASRVVPPAASVLLEAARSKNLAVRRRARDHAVRLGLADRATLLASFSLDLAQGATCRDRREAVPRLRALGDKAAVPALRKALARNGGFPQFDDVNECLAKDAAEAIEFLQALQ